MQKLCCVCTRQQFSASLDNLSPAYLTISPSILNHFWWELYQKPQSCDTDGSQSREWDFQGCLGHFQEGQGGHIQVLGVPGGDRIPSTTPGAEPPRGAKDSGSARSHSTHLETSSQKRP